MAYNLPAPVRRVIVIDGREDWMHCKPEEAEAWLVAWGAHGKPWFRAIVDSPEEGHELIDKLSFIG